VGKKGVILKNHPDIPPVRGKAGYILPVKEHPPPVRLFKARDNAEGSGFAAARRAEQGDKFPFQYRKVKSPQNFHGPKTFGYSLKTQKFFSLHVLSCGVLQGFVYCNYTAWTL
jgi:hypothetical protein